MTRRRPKKHTESTAFRAVLPLSIGLGAASFAAFLAPGIGAAGGVLHTQWLTPCAVCFIFLIQGLQIPTSEALRGFAAWPLYLFCMGWMFVAFPLLAVLIVFLFGDALSPVFRAGLLFTAFLPTTIATNAAYSSKAGGNPAVVLFNIVASNALGIVLAPLVLAWLLRGVAKGSAGIDVAPLAFSLLWQVVLPFLAGQILRSFFQTWIESKRSALRETSSLLVYFIVYVSLCNFLVRMEALEFPQGFAAMLGATTLLLALGAGTCWALLALLPYPGTYRIAAFYAASQKTLAAGLPIANAVYAACTASTLPPLALLTLPLIVFHFLQLIMGALLIPILARNAQG